MTDPLFLDTDFLSSFLLVGHEDLVLRLYAGRVGIPRQVYLELRKVHFLRTRLDALIQGQRISLHQIDPGSQAGALYVKLTAAPDEGSKVIGSGEAAAIVLAATRGGILGSNNLRDILPFIRSFQLKHLTSADLLGEALDRHLLSVGQGNVIWRDMLRRNRWLPAETFSEFLEHRGPPVEQNAGSWRRPA